MAPRSNFGAREELVKANSVKIDPSWYIWVGRPLKIAIVDDHCKLISDIDRHVAGPTSLSRFPISPQAMKRALRSQRLGSQSSPAPVNVTRSVFTQRRS